MELAHVVLSRIALWGSCTWGAGAGEWEIRVGIFRDPNGILGLGCKSEGDGIGVLSAELNIVVVVAVVVVDIVVVFVVFVVFADGIGVKSEERNIVVVAVVDIVVVFVVFADGIGVKSEEPNIVVVLVAFVVVEYYATHNFGDVHCSHQNNRVVYISDDFADQNTSDDFADQNTDDDFADQNISDDSADRNAAVDSVSQNIRAVYSEDQNIVDDFLHT